MKKLMGGLKGFKAQEFILDHAEKLAFGVGVLVCLAVLGLTDWSRYDKTPQDILKLVTEAQNKIQSSVWPDDRREAFSLQDFAGQAQEVRGPLELAPYEYSTNLWWPLYRKQELAKEPELLAVVDLQAKAGVFTLGIMPQPAVGEMVAAGEASSAAGTPTQPGLPADFDAQFSPVRSQPGAFGAAGSSEGMSSAAAASPYAPPTAPVDPTMMFESSSGEGMGYGAAPMESRGERFIAVRGVWPVWQQMEKFQRALNLQTTSDAQNFLQLVDFVLERQTAVAGSDPWAGPWDQLDIQRALDVLSEAYDYAIDPIDPRIIDPVITMPLPARLVGVWGDYATHPRIENFKLPPAEMEKERKLQEKLIQEYEKYRLEEERRTISKKGFSIHQRNIRSMAETMFESEYVNEFDNSMRTMMDQDATMRMQLPDLKSRLTAVGRLLLFRYLDFDVRPGQAYRYRVKLVLRNPNFERPLDQVIDASVAEGPERQTPWSNISNPAVVPESVNYFLEDVDRDPVEDQRPTSSRPLARLDFYEWDPEVGTMIHDTVEIKTTAQFLGETKKSLRLDVAEPSFKDSDVTFRSDDMLLDTLSDLRVDPSHHPDLKIPSSLRGKAGVVPEALVVDEVGQLAALDPTKDVNQKSYLSTYVSRERAPFESLKNQEKPTGNFLEGEYPGMYEGAYDEMGMPMDPASMKKGRRGRRSPLKPTGMSSSSGAYP